MDHMRLEMTRTKETKGAFRYEDLGNPLYTFYLRKEDAARMGNPERIIVTINHP